MPLFLVCAVFELVKPCLIGSDFELVRVHLSWNLGAGLWSGVDGCSCLTQNRISHQLCYWITWWGKLLWQEATSSSRWSSGSTWCTWGISLQGVFFHLLCSDPLSVGERWISTVRRGSGWWGKHSPGFINTKLFSLCIHHCHILYPDSWTLIHFSLAIKRVCDSQGQVRDMVSFGDQRRVSSLS